LLLNIICLAGYPAGNISPNICLQEQCENIHGPLNDILQGMKRITLAKFILILLGWWIYDGQWPFVCPLQTDQAFQTR
jgi:hypothetical protein